MENYKLNNKKSKYIIFGTFFVISMILIVTSGTHGYASSDAYDSGYDHGCDDAGISDPDDRYINQPEKGPAFHTGTFMRGGFDACSDSSEDGNDSPGDEPQEQQGQSQSQSQNLGLVVVV